MVIYEVNLAIDEGIYTEFRLWLKEHVNEMLQFPGFIQASIFKPELNEASDQEKLTIQYQLEIALKGCLMLGLQKHRN